MSKLRALWLGDYPLGDAFWDWAVFGGLAVNVATSALFALLIINDRLWGALFVGYGLSLPYNTIATVGVWRSAARYDGPAIHGDLARVATVALMVALSLT